MQTVFYLFPLQAALSHFALSRWSSFYPRFTFVEKAEWLAWTNTVIFQTSFTLANYLWFPGYASQLVSYFTEYVMFDTLLLFMYNRDPSMYLHHAISFAFGSFHSRLSYENMLAMTHAGSYLEASNILLGTTWLLNRAGYGNRLITKILGALAFVAYAVLRNVSFPYYLIMHAPWTITIMMSAFVPMNAIWTWKIAKFYLRMLRKREPAETCTVESEPCTPGNTSGRPPRDLDVCTRLASPGESE